MSCYVAYFVTSDIMASCISRIMTGLEYLANLMHMAFRGCGFLRRRWECADTGHIILRQVSCIVFFFQVIYFLLAQIRFF